MSIPHKCPVCKGRGEIPNDSRMQQQGDPDTWTKPCPACKGTCVLWEPRGFGTTVGGIPCSVTTRKQRPICFCDSCDPCSCGAFPDPDGKAAIDAIGHPRCATS